MLRAERGRQFPVSIVMIDVDGMKEANDRFGHSAGDELLRRTARLLTAGFRAEDVVARVGGDEFAVLLPATDEAAATAITRRVAARVTAWNNAHADAPISLSMGVAVAAVGQPLLTAWKEADQRMYKDKHARKQERKP